MGKMTDTLPKIDAKTVAIHEVEGVLIEMNSKLIEEGGTQRDYDIVLEVVNEIVDRLSNNEYI